MEKGLERAEEMGQWNKGCRAHVHIPRHGRTEPRVGFAQGVQRHAVSLGCWRGQIMWGLGRISGLVLKGSH